MPATGQNCNFKYMILSIQLSTNFHYPPPPCPIEKFPPYAYDYTHSCACSTDINIKLYIFFHVCWISHQTTTQHHVQLFSFSFYFIYFFYFFSVEATRILYTGVHVCLLLVDGTKIQYLSIQIHNHYSFHWFHMLKSLTKIK